MSSEELQQTEEDLISIAKAEVEKYDERRKIRIECKELSTKESLTYFRLDFEDKRLKGDMKTVMKYCNRVSKFSKSEYDSFVETLDQLNLEKFLDEISKAIIKNFEDDKRIPVKDYIYIAKYCFEIKRRYNSFMKKFEELLNKTMNEDPNEKMKRCCFILYCELFLMYQFKSEECLKRIMNYIKGLCQDIKSDFSIKTLSVFLETNGFEYVGVMTSTLAKYVAVLKTQLVPLGLITSEYQSAFYTIINKYYTEIVNKSLELHETISTLTLSSSRQLKLKGVVSPETQLPLTQTTEEFKEIHEKVLKMSELLNKTAPVYEVKKPEVVEEKLIMLNPLNNDNEDYNGPFLDLQEHVFYTDIFDITPFMINGTKGTKTETESNNSMADEDKAQVSYVYSQKDLEQIKKKDNNEVEENEDENEEPIEKLSDKVARILQNPKTGALFKTLSNAITKEDVDNWTTQFVLENTSQVRENLITYLYYNGINSMERQKYFVRAMAVIKNVARDVPKAVALKVRSHFLGKTYHLIDEVPFCKCLANYLCEFALFNLIPPSEIFGFINRLTSKLDSNRAQILAVFFERVGRYYLSIEDTSYIMKKCIDIVRNRLSNSYFSDMAAHALKESFYCCYPEERPVMHQVKLPMPYRFLNYILYTLVPKCKNKNDYSDIATLLSSFNYEDTNEVGYIVNSILDASQVCFSSIPVLAYIIAELSHNYRVFKMMLIDATAEKIKLFLIHPSNLKRQYYYGLIQLISQLYMYCVFTNMNIIQFLFLLIEFGHDVTPELQKKFSFLPQRQMLNHPLVPCDEDTFSDGYRLLLAVELLNECHSYLNHSRLMVYMCYLQRYALCKSIVSLDIMNQYNNLISKINPNPLFKSYTESDEYIAGLEKEQLEKNGKLSSNIIKLDINKDDYSENEEEEDVQRLPMEETTNEEEMNEVRVTQKKKVTPEQPNESEIAYDKTFLELMNSKPPTQTGKIDYWSKMPNKFNSDIQKSENVQLLLRNKNKMFATVTSLKPSEEFMAAKKRQQEKIAEDNKRTIIKNQLFYDDEEEEISLGQNPNLKNGTRLKRI